MSVALKLNHGIDNVLKHLWTSNATLFIDVTNQNHWCVGFFGIFQECSSTFSHLTHTASSRLKQVARYGLNRIYNQQIRLVIFQACENVFKRSFTKEETLAIHFSAGYSISPHS